MSLDDDDVIQAAFFNRMASCGTQFSVSYPLSSSVGKKGNKRNEKKRTIALSKRNLFQLARVLNTRH